MTLHFPKTSTDLSERLPSGMQVFVNDYIHNETLLVTPCPFFLGEESVTVGEAATDPIAAGCSMPSPPHTQTPEERELVAKNGALPVLIRVRQADRLRSAFPTSSAAPLAPSECLQMRSSANVCMSQIVFSRTRRRSVLGSLNDVSMLARAHSSHAAMIRSITSRATWWTRH